MTWSDTASKYHDALACAMKPYRKRELKTSDIKMIIGSTKELKDYIDLIQPSDHCINHMNDGPCKCAKTEQAIFRRLKWGYYQVL